MLFYPPLYITLYRFAEVKKKVTTSGEGAVLWCHYARMAQVMAGDPRYAPVNPLYTNPLHQSQYNPFIKNITMKRYKNIFIK